MIREIESNDIKQLAKDLLVKDKLTLVRTLRKNKREIPELFTQKLKERKFASSIFGFSKDMTLVSYKPNANKIVLLLSTLHDDDKIDSQSGDLCKPEIIRYYNSTKAGVDLVDELKQTYSVARVSRRWTLTLFFSLINIGRINAYIVHKENTVNKQLKRTDFLKTLARDLYYGYMRRHLVTDTFPTKRKFQVNVDVQVAAICVTGEKIEKQQLNVMQTFYLQNSHETFLHRMCPSASN